MGKLHLPGGASPLKSSRPIPLDRPTPPEPASAPGTAVPVPEECPRREGTSLAPLARGERGRLCRDPNRQDRPRWGRKKGRQEKQQQQRPGEWGAGGCKPPGEKGQIPR